MASTENILGDPNELSPEDEAEVAAEVEGRGNAHIDVMGKPGRKSFREEVRDLRAELAVLKRRLARGQDKTLTAMVQRLEEQFAELRHSLGRIDGSNEADRIGEERARLRADWTALGVPETAYVEHIGPSRMNPARNHLIVHDIASGAYVGEILPGVDGGPREYVPSEDVPDRKASLYNEDLARRQQQATLTLLDGSWVSGAKKAELERLLKAQPKELPSERRRRLREQELGERRARAEWEANLPGEGEEVPVLATSHEDEIEAMERAQEAAQARAAADHDPHSTTED